MRLAIGKWLRFTLLIACIALPATRSAANFVYIFSLSQLYDEAEIVAALRIDSAEPQFVAGKRCGARYGARMLRVFKPASPQRIPAAIQFGDRGGDGLSEGKEYFVTLKRIEDPETLYDEMYGRGSRWSEVADLWHLPEGLSRGEALAFLGCNGLNAALHYEIAWELAEGDAKVPPPLPSAWPATIPKRADPSVAEQWIVSKPELYLDSLGGTR
ncbi:MAG TPA: hypothetical protein VF930_00405 [Stellaceae bacterium]